MVNQDFFDYALVIAQQYQGQTSPNPAVGAVLVKDNIIIASAAHRYAGGDHAERAAIKLAGAQAAGADLYVTLEPCCHHGKTPPCVDIIINANIKQVYFAYLDPNPQVAGGGQTALIKAGIACHYIDYQPIREFYAAYRHCWQTKLPWVRLKMAQSLDAKIAGAEGQAVTMTGAQCQRYTHLQRLRSDLILTTATTIINDDPQMNVRLGQLTQAKKVAVLDRQLRVSDQAKIFTTAEQLIIFHQHDVDVNKRQSLMAKGVQCIAIANDHQGLDLTAVLTHLNEQGIRSIWAEMGAQCGHSLLTANLVQQLLIYVAPCYLGVAAKTAWLLQCDIIRHAKQLKWRIFGQDVYCEVSY